MKSKKLGPNWDYRRAEFKKDFYLVKFTIKSKKKFFRMISKMKFRKALFDPVLKAWKMPNVDGAQAFLERNKFKIKNEEKKTFPVKLPPIKKIDSSLLPGLRPYQIEGVGYLEARKGAGLIADEPGLGKTIQAIGYMKLHPEMERVLIVCPSSLKYNWQLEIKKWCNHIAFVCESTTPIELNGEMIVIINYDILQYWEAQLKANDFKLVVVDEAHLLKNPRTKRAQALFSIWETIDFILFLTGTPIENCPAEFFTMLNLLDPKEFKYRQAYLNRYCDPTFSGLDWKYNGLQNEDELISKISHLYIRRLKENVLSELPPKQRIVIPIALKFKELEEFNEKWRILEQDELEKTIIRSKRKLLRQELYEYKEEAIIKWITEFLEVVDKLVVFAWHRVALEALSKKFTNSVMVYGGMSAQKIQSKVEQFRTDPKIKIIFGQIKTLGVGHTLTNANNLVFVEFGWNPAQHTQAEDRIHRMTQTKACNIYYLVAKGTYEDRSMEILETKAKNISKVHNQNFDSFWEPTDET